VPGSGKYATHWTGDNVSTFQWMMLSIAGLVNFNIFGVPNVGADICGFDQWTNEELCRRWMQIGSLYPFSRNHNHINSRDQDPFAFGPDLIHTSMVVLKFRYSLLKYYYYLFVRNKGVGTIFKPLFFEFPEDDSCYISDTLEQQFMLGDALLVTPVLQSNTVEISPYFPGGDTFWYDLDTGVAFQGGKTNMVHNEMNQTAPVFLRDGYSIYRQNVTEVLRSDDLNNEIYFAVALKKNGTEYFAKGQFMACEDYGNYSYLQKCIDGDCLLNVDFKASLLNETVIIELGITANNNTYNETEYDVVNLNGLEIYGAEFLNNSNLTKVGLVTLDLNGSFSLAAEYQVKWSKRENVNVVGFSKNVEMKKGGNIYVEFS
jgi:alpha-glucosidase (family GH31 glycosyl hydrolase)